MRGKQALLPRRITVARAASASVDLAPTSGSETGHARELGRNVNLCLAGRNEEIGARHLRVTGELAEPYHHVVQPRTHRDSYNMASNQRTKRLVTAYDDTPNNPAVADVVERNIRTILKLRAQSAVDRTLQDRISDAITTFSGRLSFVYLHAVWFGIWLLLNTGWFGIRPFDAYPYGLLTMIVSLEAIFLSTFVLISQNRLSAESDRRADLDLHIGLLGEAELTQVLRMLSLIQNHLGIESVNADELADLQTKTTPEDILAEVERLRARKI